MCDCFRNLQETANYIKTDIGITLIVYICVSCKQYYVKVNDKIIPIKFNYDKHEWELWNNMMYM